MLQRFCCAKIVIISIETQKNIIYFQSPYKYLTLLIKYSPKSTILSCFCCIFTQGNETGIPLWCDNPKNIVPKFPDYSSKTPWQLGHNSPLSRIWAVSKPYLSRIWAVFMPYDTIRHKYGKDSVYKLQFLEIEKNYPRVLRESSKNIWRINKVLPVGH